MVVAVVAVIVMLVLVVGAVMKFKGSSKTEGFVYHGKGGDYRIDVVNRPDLNVTLYYVHARFGDQNVVFPLRNAPDDVTGVYFGDGVLDAVGKRVVYVTRDAELIEEVGGYANVAASEFEKVLKYSGIKIFPALTVKDESRPLYAQASCGNVSKGVGVVYMKLGDDDRVYVDDGCVIVEGKDRDGLIKSADRISYVLLGVL